MRQFDQLLTPVSTGLICTLCVWLTCKGFSGQAKCHDELHLVSFRRDSLCSAHVQALGTEEDPCSCRGLEQLHKPATPMT